MKLGEEARVFLETFSLEGKKMRNLRNALHKQENQGFEFLIVPARDVEAYLPEAKAVSDRWLKNKRAREKRFSLGYFDEDYLKRCDLAVVKREGRLLAFANLWRPVNRQEFSLDLMRYDPQAPNGIMEYMTVKLILWAKENGFVWFNLGMAPLSGLEKHPLSPLWHKIGNKIFRFGSEFYNFEGLYQYKNKFGPVWRPRYLAAPTGLQIASTLWTIRGLVSSRKKKAGRK